MHIDVSTRKGPTRNYKRVLLRTSYRDKGKVKHRTIANLSGCSDDEIEAIRLALKHKKNLPAIWSEHDQAVKKFKYGLSFGAVYTLFQVANRLNISSSLGSDQTAKLALWQIIARLIGQGSRLSAVRLANQHAACDVLELEEFNEEHLYKNLDWLACNQRKIEDEIFNKNRSDSAVNLFLYDVTSSYFEGTCNEYADYGYNRDKKRGKMQVVIGLLTDSEGDPVSIQVFQGNTSDTKTFMDQVHKVCESLKIRQVTFVGDRGMIKRPQIEELPSDCSYITALTKPQIQGLLDKKKIVLENFQETIQEVEINNVRYILRRNLIRQQEIRSSRNDKFEAVKKYAREKTRYLEEHPRASINVAIRNVQGKIEKLQIAKWVKVALIDKTIVLSKDQEQLVTESLLDGCYIIKTNLPKSSFGASSSIIHSRYKDLAHVEWAFRTMKTSHLEIRPHYVRKTMRTEGHVFIVMLAYKIIRELRAAWNPINITVEEGIAELGSICLMTHDDWPSTLHFVPKPREQASMLLKALDITLPETVITTGVNVATRKKLRKSC